MTRKARRPQAGAPSLLVADTVGAIDEFDLIDRLTRFLPKPPRPVPVDLGDDAALVPTAARTLVTTDTHVEGVHFRRDWSLPEEVGQRALEVNLSDIAAMGGVPEWAVISLLLPPDLPVTALEGVYRGLARSARRAKVGIVGGNISRSGGGPLSVTITVLGRSVGRQPILRSGARPGDLILVTGTPGLAAAGRQLLEDSGPGADLWRPTASRSLRSTDRPTPRPEYALADPAARQALKRFLTPEARLAAGAWAARSGASALIDLSDGLAADLGHILKASGCGARLELTALPRAKGFQELCATRSWRPDQLALFGGDDYELLLTLAPRQWARAAKNGQSRACSATVIGEITGEPGLLIVADGRREALLEPRGWRHTGG